MGILQAEMAGKKKRLHEKSGIPLSLPQRPERNGCRRLSCCFQQKQIFVQAPTGVGKTMSSVFPSVRAIGEGKGELLFYLTAKTITRTVAQDAFEILRTKGLLFRR